MKKTYKKPMFAAEMFVMNQSIARDCADSIPKDLVDFNDINSCKWHIAGIGGGITVFIAGRTCDLDGESMGFACYNNPSEENQIFRS